jgi:hypothetical protein
MAYVKRRHYLCLIIAINSSHKHHCVRRCGLSQGEVASMRPPSADSASDPAKGRHYQVCELVVDEGTVKLLAAYMNWLGLIALMESGQFADADWESVKVHALVQSLCAINGLVKDKGPSKYIPYKFKQIMPLLNTVELYWALPLLHHVCIGFITR